MTTVLSSFEQETIKSYNRYGDDWTQQHQIPSLAKEQELAFFHSLLPKGKLLEIGAGSGRDATILLSSGYDYIGIEPSETLVQYAQKRNPHAVFLKQTVYDMDFEPQVFDGFYASAVLLHIPKQNIRQVLKKIHSVIKTDGIGFISVKEGTGESMREDVTQDGKAYQRFFSYYTKKEMEALLKETGFHVLKQEKRANGYSKSNSSWLIFFVSVHR